MIPAMDWLLTTPIAHRGLHDASGGVPENSLAAFEAARDAGFPIELDVRALCDGAVAVFHDEDLQRLTGVDAPLAREDSRSIATRRLADTGHGIPLLEQVLDVVAGKVGLVIELKNFGAPGGLESAVGRALVPYGGPAAVQSFNPNSMAWFARHAPHLPRGHLSGGFPGAGLDGALPDSLRQLDTIGISMPHYIGFDIRLLPCGPLACLRRDGTPVVGWTVRSHRDRRAALAHCDNYIFEHIDPFSPDDES